MVGTNHNLHSSPYFQHQQLENNPLEHQRIENKPLDKDNLQTTIKAWENFNNREKLKTEPLPKLTGKEDETLTLKVEQTEDDDMLVIAEDEDEDEVEDAEDLKTPEVEQTEEDDAMYDEDTIEIETLSLVEVHETLKETNAFFNTGEEGRKLAIEMLTAKQKDYPNIKEFHDALNELKKRKYSIEQNQQNSHSFISHPLSWQNHSFIPNSPMKQPPPSSEKVVTHLSPLGAKSARPWLSKKEMAERGFLPTEEKPTSILNQNLLQEISNRLQDLRNRIITKDTFLKIYKEAVKLSPESRAQFNDMIVKFNQTYSKPPVVSNQAPKASAISNPGLSGKLTLDQVDQAINNLVKLYQNRGITKKTAINTFQKWIIKYPELKNRFEEFNRKMEGTSSLPYGPQPAIVTNQNHSSRPLPNQNGQPILGMPRQTSSTGVLLMNPLSTTPPYGVGTYPNFAGTVNFVPNNGVIPQQPSIPHTQLRTPHSIPSFPQPQPPLTLPFSSNFHVPPYTPLNSNNLKRTAEDFSKNIPQPMPLMPGNIKYFQTQSSNKDTSNSGRPEKRQKQSSESAETGIEKMAMLANERDFRAFNIALNSFDLSKKDDKGNSLLHRIVLQKNLATYIDAVLKEGGALLDMPNREGNTPLHLAVKVQSLTTVKVLVARGADLNKKNNDGKNPKEISNTKQINEYFEGIEKKLGT
jgi:hypothetical protein